MERTVFQLREQVYSTASAYHRAGAAYLAAQQADAPAGQALRAFYGAGARYDAALDALQQHLTYEAPAMACEDELWPIQRTLELLRQRLAQLRTLME